MGSSIEAIYDEKFEPERKTEPVSHAARSEGKIEPAPYFIEACARAAYEVNRAYCIALGDTSFGPWENAPEWQRETNRKGVKCALEGAGPEKMHESWLAEKVATGWKYGPVKDPEKKEHPCMVPYTDLPSAQRAKDSIFLAVVNSVAAALGIDYLTQIRAKMQQCIDDLSSVSNKDLLKVLHQTPYRVSDVWMVNEPAPSLSEKMGYPCFTATIISRPDDEVTSVASMTVKEAALQAISFAYGNLASSTHHKPDREAFRALWVERGLLPGDFDAWANKREWMPGS